MVSDLFVVTAASIFDYDNPNDPSPQSLDNPANIEVAVIFSNGEPPIMSWKKIERIWVHPYYKRTNIEVPSSDLSYNVALLKLKKRLDFNTKFRENIGIRPDMQAIDNCND